MPAPADESLELHEGLGPAGDLAKAPRPPRTMRTITLAVMSLTALGAIVLAVGLGSEARYALADPGVVELGDLATAALGNEQTERYARARIELVGGVAVGFRRSFEPGSYQVALAGGDGGGRWVVYQVPPALDGPRFVTPTLVAGRLAPLSDLGPRYRGLAERMARAAGKPVDGAWVLIDGQRPDSAGWILGLAVLLGVFFVWNAWSIAVVLGKVGTKPER